MKSAFVLLPLFVIGCAKSGTPNSDSSVVAGTPAASLSDADVAGTWTGTAKIAGTDSVISHWTQVCTTGTCRLTSQENMKDTVSSTYTIMGDSAVGQSQPYAIPGVSGQVIDHWTVHPVDGKVTGAGYYTLASKPDSVIVRYTVEGAKQS